MINDLVLQHELGKADEVIITGISAGGLAVYYGLDSIQDQIFKYNRETTVRGLSYSGFFLDFPHLFKDLKNKFAPKAAYSHSHAMRRIFHLARMESGINKECILYEKAHGDPKRCIFAKALIRFIKTPVFSIQVFELNTSTQ